MRLSLLHKGLLLVSIPLCFELGIFALLLGLQNEMAQEAERLNKSRMIGDTVNRLTHSLLLMTEHLDHADNVISLKRKLISDFNTILGFSNELAGLTTDNPYLHNTVLKCIAQIQAARADMIRIERMVALGQITDISDMSRQSRHLLNEHITNIVTAGIFELSSASAHEIDTDNSAAMRSRMVFLLKCAVATSALIAIAGATIFSRNLNSRLQVVVKNAAKLGERQPLLKPISGTDEIADLDKAVHQAATVIQRLEQAREEIIGMVSHDIRTPLNTIRCSGELLEMNNEESMDDRSKQLVKTIASNCDRILRISQDLLDMQKLEAGMLTISKEPTDLQQCFVQAIEATAGLRESRSIKIETNFVPVQASVDGGRIEQVLTNLISNAIKHSPKGGVVKLTLRKSGSGDSAYLAVSDCGKGIPDSLKAAVFDRFRQVDNDDAKRGTGLGLAICKALVELHGGRLGIEDEKPTGSKFWIRLPLS
jgi:signal transduction histidine kinase